MKRSFQVCCIALIGMSLGIAGHAQKAGSSLPPRQPEDKMTEIGHSPYREMREAVREAWSISWSLSSEAQDRYNEGKFTEAVRLCKDAQEFAPLGADGSQMVNHFAQYIRGFAYLHLGEDEKALQMLLPLNSIQNKGESYLAQAIAYARLGNGKMGREMYQRFQRSGEEIILDAENFWKDTGKEVDQRQFLTRAWHSYGNLELSGKPRLALLDYQKAKTLNPNNPLIDFDLGFVLSRLERFEEASHYFQSAVKAGKGDFLNIARKELGLALSDLKEQRARREAEIKKQQDAR